MFGKKRDRIVQTTDPDDLGKHRRYGKCPNCTDGKIAGKDCIACGGVGRRSL